MTRRPPRVPPVLLFNLGLTVAGLAVLELAFGHWFTPNRTDRLNLVRDCTKRYDASALYDDAGEILYTRDEWGLRGAYESLDRIDILTIGGSATDQRYITDGATWQDVIVREFAREGRSVSVVNAGVDGQSTYGHIKNFDWWFPTLPEFRPRYVLFYITGNDLYKGHDSEFDDLVNEAPPTWRTHVRERSALYRMARIGVGVYRARHRYRITHHRAAFGSWEWTTQPLARSHARLVSERTARYRKAVAMLAAKTRALGAVPVFVTQSLSTYRIRADGRVEGNARTEVYDRTIINGVDLYYIVCEFWAAAMEECAKSGGVCIDAGNDVRWQPGDFYDAIHNTPQGAERLGMYLHSRLRELPVGVPSEEN